MTSRPDERLTAFDSQSEPYERAFATFLAHTDQKRQARAWLDGLIDRLPRHETFIDAGAGNGVVTQWFIDRFQRTIAIEPSEFLRDDLARNCPTATVIPDFIQDARPAAPGDMVLCSHVLYYLEQSDWMPTLHALAKFLAPTGTLAVIVQNSGTDCMQLLERFHGRRFDLAALGREFQKSNPETYQVSLETIPSVIETRDLATTYEIAEFMLNLLPFEQPPLRQDVIDFIEARFRHGQGHRLTCSQDVLIVRPA